MQRFRFATALRLTALLLLTGCTSLRHGGGAAASEESGKTVLAAAIQAKSILGAPEKNRLHFASLVREAAGKGAKIIVLPETAITGYMSPDLKTTWHIPGRTLTEGLSGMHPEKYAETVPGPSTFFFGKLAAAYHIYITVPLLERDPQTGSYYNTSVLVGPDGAILLHYRKRNPWPYAETGWASQGDLGNVYADTPYGRLSLMICYDINYEPARIKALHIDHVLYSIAWVDIKKSDWFPAGLPALAKEYDFNIIGANWAIPAGLNPEWVDNGQSVIIDRAGILLAHAGATSGEQILYACLPIP